MATPFTSFLHLTQASSGATRNSGTNGDLNALLNWALPQAGWTRTFDNAGTNESVFKPPSGIRNSLYVRHNSTASGNAGLSVIRGCEGATNYNALVDPFPQVAQVADTSSNWLISSSASTSPRNFHIYVWETGVIYFSQYTNTTDAWEWGGFLDGWSRFTTDAYNTTAIVRNSASLGTTIITQATASSFTGANPACIYFMRDVAGVIKSSRGLMDGRGTTLGSVAGSAAIRAGFGNQVERSKLCIHDSSSTSATLGVIVLGRTCLPNMWSPVHAGLSGVGELDLLTDTAYDPTASFILLKSSGGNNGVIMENTNTSTGYPAG